MSLGPVGKLRKGAKNSLASLNHQGHRLQVSCASYQSARAILSPGFPLIDSPNSSKYKATKHMRKQATGTMSHSIKLRTADTEIVKY